VKDAATSGIPTNRYCSMRKSIKNQLHPKHFNLLSSGVRRQIIDQKLSEASDLGIDVGKTRLAASTQRKKKKKRT